MSLTPLLIVVIGTTGSGKTKLSVELAEAMSRNLAVKSEIVSADSMQIYRRLDVLSAKATIEEQARVKHHLLDIVDVDDSSFTVATYQQLATGIISELLSTQTVPILVGGTNFYIESVLWDQKYKFEPPIAPLDPVLKQELDEMSNEALHAKLKAVDPPRAELLHPNARRKVMRSLEIFYTAQKPHSRIIAEQQAHSNKLKFQTCFFWVHCEKNVLNQRLNDRVDDMVSRGLKEELKMVAKAFKDKDKLDWQKGALQSIGLHEFRTWIHDYQKEGTDNCRAFENAVEEVKIHSRQYAKGQISWIRNSLEPSCLIYRLDSTDPKQWRDKVLNPAISIVSALMQGQNVLDIEALVQRDLASTVHIMVPNSSTETSTTTTWRKYHCELCKKTANGEAEWKAHEKSKAHKANRRRHFKPRSGPPVLNSSVSMEPRPSSSTDPL